MIGRDGDDLDPDAFYAQREREHHAQLDAEEAERAAEECPHGRGPECVPCALATGQAPTVEDARAEEHECGRPPVLGLPPVLVDFAAMRAEDRGINPAELARNLLTNPTYGAGLVLDPATSAFLDMAAARCAETVFRREPPAGDAALLRDAERIGRAVEREARARRFRGAVDEAADRAGE